LTKVVFAGAEIAAQQEQQRRRQFHGELRRGDRLFGRVSVVVVWRVIPAIPV